MPLLIPPVAEARTAAAAAACDDVPRGIPRRMRADGDRQGAGAGDAGAYRAHNLRNRRHGRRTRRCSGLGIVKIVRPLVAPVEVGNRRAQMREQALYSDLAKRHATACAARKGASAAAQVRHGAGTERGSAEVPATRHVRRWPGSVALVQTSPQLAHATHTA